jgi:hypothetical protein
MADKSQFEIRLELLQMSREYFSEVHNNNLEFANRAFEKSLEINQALIEQWQKIIFTPYGSSEMAKITTTLFSLFNRTDD